MPDCKSPQCHEAVRLSLSDKVSKKALWIALVAIGFPLLVTGIKVWSQQENDHLRFAEKKEVIEWVRKQAELQTSVKHLTNDIKDIKKGQEATQKDIKKILEYLRDNH